MTDEEVAREIAARKKMGKGSFQKTADGKKFAPWLDIDEDAVAEVKKAREARLKREGRK